MASRFSKSIVNAFSRIVVFLFVCLSMVFFFSASISDAWYFLGHLFIFSASSVLKPDSISYKLSFFIALGIFVLIFISEMLNEKGTNLTTVFLKQTMWFKIGVYLILILSIYFSNSDFIPFEYMKF